MSRGRGRRGRRPAPRPVRGARLDLPLFPARGPGRARRLGRPAQPEPPPARRGRLTPKTASAGSPGRSAPASCPGNGTIMSPPARRRRPPAWPALPGWPGGTGQDTPHRTDELPMPTTTAPGRAELSTRAPGAATLGPPGTLGWPPGRPRASASGCAGSLWRGAGRDRTLTTLTTVTPSIYDSRAGHGQASKIRHPTDVSHCKLQEICHASNSATQRRTLTGSPADWTRTKNRARPALLPTG